MQFIYPEFLFALFALSIPVIIHLFNFRRFRKIYFTNVRFLKEIKQDTQSRSRLKHLLILLMRLLALAFLVFAFAQPYLPVNNNQLSGGTRHIGVYLDNSFSMEAIGRNGSLLETGKRKAREIADAYKPSDKFQLLTNDFEGKQQRLVNREEFLRMVDEVQISPAVRTLPEVIQRQQEALFSGSGKATVKIAYQVSDFQKSISDLGGITADTSMKNNFVPVEAVRRSNLYVDTCFLRTPFVQLNSPNDLVVKIRNNGEQDGENVPLRLTINGVQKAIASISVPAGSTGETTLTFSINEPGWQQAELSITDYPITFDDQFYFTFNVRPGIQVMSINGDGESQAINAIFGNDPYFILKNNPAGQIDYSLFPAMQLIILNEVRQFSSGMILELKRYAEQGGSVFIIPSEEADLNSYRELMESTGTLPYGAKTEGEAVVGFIERQHHLFSDVFESGKPVAENLDLPVAKKFYTFLREGRSSTESVMRFRDGQSFLTAASTGNGYVYAFAVSLNTESSNLSRHALFVPIMLRAALQGSSEITKPLVIGRDRDFLVTDTLISSDNVFHLVNEPLGFNIIPENRPMNNSTLIAVYDQVGEAGNYVLTGDGKIISAVAFNYDRKESGLDTWEADELSEAASRIGTASVRVIDPEKKELTHSIMQEIEGRRLWKYCIILALVFLGLEVLLIRFFKRT